MKFTKLASLLLLANTFAANSYGAEPTRPQELTESRLADGRVTLEEL